MKLYKFICIKESIFKSERSRALCATVNRFCRTAFILFFVGQAVAETSDQPARFKNFIAQPPQIERLIFIKKLYPDPNKAEPVDIGIRDSTNFLYYSASWKPNAFFIKTGPTPETLLSQISGIWVFRCQKDYWLLQPGRHALHWLDERASADEPRFADPTNQVFSVASFLGDDLGRVLNMGVYNAPIGGIQWQGDRFQAHFAELHQDISGQIASENNGMVDHLDVEYRTSKRTAKYRAYYTYAEPMLLGFLPHNVRICEIRNSTEVERDNYTIITITTAFDIPDSPFRPAAVLASHGLKPITYRNGKYYEKVRGREIPVPARALALRDRTISNRTFFYTLAFIVTSIFLALAVRAKASATTANRKGSQ
ncbi:MAG: hypothetical protein L0Z50_32600 [Verrucomicrobiales bacterium]|nr:hypothetical protein [Verrucomicrobiales bacterium]